MKKTADKVAKIAWNRYCEVQDAARAMDDTRRAIEIVGDAWAAYVKELKDNGVWWDMGGYRY